MVRDGEIYERYRQGETVVVLAQAYDLSVSRIRWIIQHMARKA